MPSERDLLATDRGCVVAPAGCGKTELIVRAAAIHHGKPILILTHTNAGLRALRDRMRRLRVSPANAHVDTIAGWALRYAVSYPATSGHGNHDPEGAEWERMYGGVAALLDARAIQAVVRATYSRLFVDEYQDCSTLQHDLVRKLAAVVPTCVLGDPLQGIFDFGSGIVAWPDVTREFPSLGELSEPWRWKSRNDELGKWCLELRHALLNGHAIDLSKPSPITWRELDQGSQRSEAYRLARSEGSIIVIRKWEHQAHGFARSLGGLYRSMEEVEGKAFRAFATAMDTLHGPARAASIVELAADCMTGIKTAIATVANALENGKVPTPRQSKKHPTAVAALISVCGDSSPAVAHAAMCALEELPGCGRFRSELWSSAKKALKEHPSSGRALVAETAAAIRQQHRAAGRLVDPRLVSRTLLVKGLEFDHAFIPNAAELDSDRNGDGARHFYVAATRASRSLSIQSASPIVQFTRPSI